MGTCRAGGGLILTVLLWRTTAAQHAASPSRYANVDVISVCPKRRATCQEVGKVGASRTTAGWYGLPAATTRRTDIDRGSIRPSDKNVDACLAAGHVQQFTAGGEVGRSPGASRIGALDQDRRGRAVRSSCDAAHRQRPLLLDESCPDLAHSPRQLEGGHRLSGSSSQQCFRSPVAGASGQDSTVPEAHGRHDHGAAANSLEPGALGPDGYKVAAAVTLERSHGFPAGADRKGLSHRVAGGQRATPPRTPLVGGFGEQGSTGPVRAGGPQVLLVGRHRRDSLGTRYGPDDLDGSADRDPSDGHPRGVRRLPRDKQGTPAGRVLHRAERRGRRQRRQFAEPRRPGRARRGGRRHGPRARGNGGGGGAGLGSSLRAAHQEHCQRQWHPAPTAMPAPAGQDSCPVAAS